MFQHQSNMKSDQIHNQQLTHTKTSSSSSSYRKHAHSRIHSRNLSIYFPSPDKQSSSIHPSSPPNLTNLPISQILDIPPADIIAWDLHQLPITPSNPLFSPSQPTINPSTPISSQDSHPRTRRGHHHRHSLSHNFFPFLSETTPPNTSTPLTHTIPAHKSLPPSATSQSFSSWKFPAPSTTPISAIPKPVPYHQSSSKQSLPRNLINRSRLDKKITHLNMPLKILINLYFYTPLITKLKILIGLLTGLLGCIFWLKAQEIHLLSLSGLGYLLVFDALGILYRIWFDGDADGIETVWEALGTKEHDSNLKLPFGRARINTLSQFGQALYLIFSGIYVAKEAFEHLLITHPHSPSDHAIPGRHSHSPHDLHSNHPDLQTDLPFALIMLSELLVLFSALISKNHHSLNQLISVKQNHPTQDPQQPSSGIQNKPIDFAKINRFSGLPLAFGATILLAGYCFSPSQLEKADRLISCVMVYFIFQLAWPLACLTGQVLLQTAPLESESKTLSALNSAIETIQRGNEAVIKKNLLYIEPITVWRLTISESDLICNIIMHVKQDTKDAEILAITELVRNSLSGIGSEINVDVVRGEDKKCIVRASPSAGAGCSHHHHHHHHDHDHDHHHDAHHHHHHHEHQHEKHESDHHHHQHEGKSKTEIVELKMQPQLISQLSSDHSSSSSDHSEICSSDDDLHSIGLGSSGDDPDHRHHHQLGHHHSHLHLH